jgi:hypothetical protein
MQSFKTEMLKYKESHSAKSKTSFDIVERYAVQSPRPWESAGKVHKKNPEVIGKATAAPMTRQSATTIQSVTTMQSASPGAGQKAGGGAGGRGGGDCTCPKFSLWERFSPLLARE